MTEKVFYLQRKGCWTDIRKLWSKDGEEQRYLLRPERPSLEEEGK